MGYENLMGMMMIGVQALMAYLAVSFSDRDSFGKLLQSIFLIVCIGLIPVDVGLLRIVMEADGVVDANLLSLIDSVYISSIVLVCVFIAIIFIKLVYTGLVKPLKSFSHPDDALVDVGVLR